MRRLLILTFLFSISSQAATINVQVTSSDGKAVKDAVVYAIPPAPMPLAKRVAVMDQIKRTFVPHVLPVQTGTWVEFPNSDNVRHQVFSVSPARRFETPLYIGKPARPIQFPVAGVVALGCSIHEQMSAFIVVVDTPYFATTAEGRAAIQDVIPGNYTLHVWYPGMRTEPEPHEVAVLQEDLSISIPTSE